jgi:trigger factor
MEARLEKIESSEAHIEITVDAEKMEEGFEKAYRKVVKQVSVPGFRKGRVPRQLLEAHFGKEVLYQDALEYIVPLAYEEALTMVDIEPIAQPEFDIEDINPGEEFKFKAIVAVKPEVKLGDFTDLEVTIPPMTVSDENVEQRLEDIRQRYAEIVEKTDEPALLGDTVTIDFEGFLDGVPFEGGKDEDYPLELGSDTFIPGFEQQLVGMKVGEEKDVEVTFPEYYHGEDLAGKEAVFKVAIKKITAKKARELNDEFAQEISEFETIEELRADIRKSMEAINEQQKKEIIQQSVINQAVDRCEMEVPKAAVQAQTENMMRQLEQRMISQGISMDQYFQITNSNEEEFQQSIWPEAERMVMSNFMLEKIVEEKGFVISDEEIDKYIEQVAQGMGMETEAARERLETAMDRIIFSLKIDKAIEYLVDNAKVTEQDPVIEQEKVEPEQNTVEVQETVESDEEKE